MRSQSAWGAAGFTCVFASLLGSALTARIAYAQDDQAGGARAGAVKRADDTAAPPTAPPPVTKAVLKLPVVLKDDGADYPRQAVADKVRADVTVDLVVEVTVEGTVKNASVVEPKGHGFDEAAVAAAMKLRFQPATRDGNPIAAKINHRYAFVAPPGQIRLRVASDIDDKPVAGAAVVVRDEKGTEIPATTGPDGTITVPGLAAGKLTLRVAAEGFESATSQEAVEPGEEVGLTLRLVKVARNALPSPPLVPGEAAVQEVEVRGTRPPREVTKRTLEQRELQRIPGTGGDALRALQNLPGIARPPGLAGLLIVRGSAPSDTNVFADGSLIPIVYHFGGLSSVVPTEALEKLDFYPGNFSSQYGRVMGGVVDIGLRDPQNKDGKIHGLGQVDLIDARLLVEGPIGNTGWNFLVAGRRSYVDVWLKPVLEKANFGVATAPVYYDYQLMAFKKLSETQDVRVAFIGSDDRLDIVSRALNGTEPGISGVSTGIGFWRAQVRYRNKLTESTEWRTMASVGQDFVDFNLGNFFFKLKTFPIALRSEVSHKLSTGVTANIGVDFLDTPYDIALRLPPPPKPGEPPAGPFSTRPPLVVDETGTLYRPATYAEFELTPARGTRIVPGVRIDYTKDTKSWDVSPRFVARQDLHSDFPRTTLKGGMGVFRQPPQPQDTNAVFGQPGLTSNTAYHYSFGGEREFTKQIELSLEGFYKDLRDLIVTGRRNEGTGRVFGGEVLFRYKPDDKFFGWLAYTLSRSERKDNDDSATRLFQYDQTHILTLLGSYRLGNGWEVGARYRLVSGSLTTPNQYGFFDGNSGSYVAQASFPPYGERLPSFQQLDVRIDKVWKYPGVTMNAYLDVQNVYNAPNVEGVSYNYNFSQRTNGLSLPIIPNLGFRIEL